MPCEIHSWWFDTTCPKCAAATVTVTETPPESPVEHVSDPTPSAAADAPPQTGGHEDRDGLEVASEPTDDGTAMLSIPDYLKRNKDNTFAHPAMWGSELKPLLTATVTPAEDVREWSDERLQTALSVDMSIAERQPIIQEFTRRQNKKKAYERLDKAGFTKAKLNDSGDPE